MIHRLLFLALLIVGIAAAQARIVILIGPPGSGKSTQSAFLKQKFGYRVIAAEDLIRENPQAFKKRTALLVDNIEPQNDSAMNQLVETELKKADLSKGVVLDGYPATKEHCDHLKALAQKIGLTLPTILWLNVPDEVVVKRLEQRKTPGETADKIAQRMKDFHREMDMIHIYFPDAKINPVDATKKPGQVSKQIEAILASR